MIFKAYPVKTERGGRTYNASYEMTGGRLVVSSAYGSKACILGKKDAKREAERLLDEIIKERH